MLQQYLTFFLLLSQILSLAFGAKPSEVSVTLDKATAGGSDDIYIGQTEIVVMTIKFPGGTTHGVKVELLPSTTETVFALGDIINHTVGADIVVDNDSWFSNVIRYPGPEYTDTKLGNFYDTRAAFDLGDVNNDGSNNAEIESYITITYEIVYVDMASYSDGSEYWVSCGMAYNSDANIWISQFSHILRGLDSDFSGTTDFNLENMTEIQDGGIIHTTNLEMTISKARAAVKVEALVLTETQDITPVKIEMVSASAAYSYSLRTGKFLAKRYDDCAVRDTNQQSLELDVGTIVNKESQKSTSSDDNKIVIRILWVVTSASAVGNQYTLGVGVNLNGSEISVATFNVTVTSRANEAPAFTGYTAGAYNTSIVESGGIGIALLNLTIPTGSFHTYLMTLSTNKKSEITSKLFILSYSMAFTGDNVPCGIEENVELYTFATDTSNPDVRNEANMTFSVLNTGLMSTDYFGIKIIMMAMTDANKNDIYELYVDINGSSEIVEFTIGDQRAYDGTVGYVFKTANPSGSKIPTGSQFMMEMTVNTTRNSLPGPMTIEMPIPDSLPYLKLVQARTKSRGANVVCPPTGVLEANTSLSWNDSLNDNARAVISIPMVCNIQTKDDVNEDIWIVQFDLLLVDHVDLLATSEQTIDYGVGVVFSGNQIYIGGVQIVTIPPDDLTEVKLVTGITIDDSPPPSVWPGGYVLQWSIDLSEFFSHSLEWVPTSSGVDSTFSLKKPILARYTRLATPTSTNSLPYNYTVNAVSVVDKIQLLGDSSKVNTLLPKLMYALDGDMNTCMNLPLKNDTNIPPYLISQVNTQVLNERGILDSSTLTASFKIQHIGEGISCNTTAGPQRTLVWHPAEALTSNFHGKLSKCQVSADDANYSGSKTRCEYTCTCDSDDKCGHVIVALIHDNNPSGGYNLCELSLIQ